MGWQARLALLVGPLPTILSDDGQPLSLGTRPPPFCLAWGVGA